MTVEEWAIPLEGVIESVCTTSQPTGQWNVAALGLHTDRVHDADGFVRARTWGDTRTRNNFERCGGGYVHFGIDPVTFVDAALSRWTIENPILEDAHMWVQVETVEVQQGESGGTEWTDWKLVPIDQHVEEQVVPLLRRAEAAVVEMTIAVSRLDVDAYDSTKLEERIAYFSSVVDRCGGPQECAARDRIIELSEWEPTSSETQ